MTAQAKKVVVIQLMQPSITRNKKPRVLILKTKIYSMKLLDFQPTLVELPPYMST